MLSGQLCRCTGLHADRRRDRGGRGRVNLALSLLYAAERDARRGGARRRDASG